LLVVHRGRASATAREPLDVPGMTAWLGVAAVAIGLGAATLALYSDRVGPIVARMSEPALAPQPALTLRVLGRYAWLAVWPVSLSADYRAGAWELPDSALDGPSLAAAITLVAIVVAGAWLAWRGAIAGAGLLWFVASLLPVSQVIPYAEVVAEHNAYLGLAGLALAVGQGAALALRRYPRAAIAGLAVVLVLLSARSFVRAGDWRDDATLWTATVAAHPGSQRARYNLGVALVEANRLVEGREALLVAQEASPDDRDVLLALSGVETRLGSHDRALALAQRALDQQRDGAALLALGWAQLGAGDTAAAAASFEAAIAAGGPAEAERGLALARRRRGQP
jgi:hypothetical protein